MGYQKNKRGYRNITQRYCHNVGDNVVVECVHGADHDEFTCISNYCGNCETCERYINNVKSVKEGNDMFC